MEHVPLVRPSFPEDPSFMSRWHASTKESGQFANFGPLWKAAVGRIAAMTGRYALPCSSGTEAVALAVGIKLHEAPLIKRAVYEAFTFEATLAALDRHAEILGAIIPAASGYESPPRKEKDTLHVRTIPFGMKRLFEDEEHLVIDAAGAFPAVEHAPKNAIVACSFHATKNFPIGEGGVVLCVTHEQWEIGKRMMNFGFDEEKLRSTFYATNGKLDELHCALLLAQLDRFLFFKGRSARIRNVVSALSDIEGLFTPSYKLGEMQSMAVVEAHNPQAFIAFLHEHGYAARRVYAPSSNEDLFTDAEKRMVAIPSDMTINEFANLVNILNEKDTWK